VSIYSDKKIAAELRNIGGNFLPPKIYQNCEDCLYGIKVSVYHHPNFQKLMQLFLLIVVRYFKGAKFDMFWLKIQQTLKSVVCRLRFESINTDCIILANFNRK
jgi:hypothetical protein